MKHGKKMDKDMDYDGSSHGRDEKPNAPYSRANRRLGDSEKRDPMYRKKYK